MSTLGKIAELMADLLIRHGKPDMAREQVHRLFRQTDQSARAEEALAIAKELRECGMVEAAAFVFRRAETRLLAVQLEFGPTTEKS